MVQCRALEDLDRRTAGRQEGDGLLHATGRGVGGGQWLDRDTGLLNGRLHAPQSQVVPDLPAHGLDPVLVTGKDHDAPGALVHAQVQRVLLRAAALREADRLVGERPPGRHVTAADPHVAERTDVSHLLPL